MLLVAHSIILTVGATGDPFVPNLRHCLASGTA